MLCAPVCAGVVKIVSFLLPIFDTASNARASILWATENRVTSFSTITIEFLDRVLYNFLIIGNRNKYCTKQMHNINCILYIVYKVLPIASHICFHQKSTTLAYVLEVNVTLSPFAQTSKSSFIPRSLFSFLWFFFHLECLIYSVLYYCITFRLSFVQ